MVATPVCLILGDNIFFGHGLTNLLSDAANRSSGATIFAYHVQDPQRYGVVTFDKSGRALKIVEKPTHTLSNWAVTGLYFYDNSVVRLAKGVKASARGELKSQISIHAIWRQERSQSPGWDAVLPGSTPEHFKSLIDAACFVQTLEQRQGIKICCPRKSRIEWDISASPGLLVSLVP